jgi:hypothetical protein
MARIGGVRAADIENSSLVYWRSYLIRFRGYQMCAAEKAQIVLATPL